jgi:hypothetical protein
MLSREKRERFTILEDRMKHWILTLLLLNGVVVGQETKALDCTPKMRHEVKGRPTLNGEVYGCGPENLQPRSEDRGDAGN